MIKSVVGSARGKRTFFFYNIITMLFSLLSSEENQFLFFFNLKLLILYPGIANEQYCGSFR